MITRPLMEMRKVPISKVKENRTKTSAINLVKWAAYNCPVGYTTISPSMRIEIIKENET